MSHHTLLSPTRAQVWLGRETVTVRQLSKQVLASTRDKSERESVIRQSASDRHKHLVSCRRRRRVSAGNRSRPSGLDLNSGPPAVHRVCTHTTDQTRDSPINRQTSRPRTPLPWFRTAYTPSSSTWVSTLDCAHSVFTSTF